MNKNIILCILDGWGEGKNSTSNAVSQSNTPCWDLLNSRFRKSLLSASGQDVGLPNGQMGNSEVGHMNIGAGRIVLQDLPRINKAILDGDLANNAKLRQFISSLKQAGKPCHLMGLLSSGGVHSHIDHILTLATIMSNSGVKTYVHAFLDGRDTPPQSAIGYVKEFIEQITPLPDTHLASLSGRYYAMDRDNRWERIDKAVSALIKAEAPYFDDPLTMIQESYNKGVNDEFIVPCIERNYSGIESGSGILVANFRADRIRQILTRFVENPDLKQSKILGMVSYSKDLNQHIDALFPPQNIKSTLGEIISQEGLKQLRIAETEKYAHVTYFLNGGVESPFSLEDRIMVPSPKVATYDLKPEMSSTEVTNKLCDAIDSQKYNLIVVNYANADMVGHTGNLPAAIKAIEALDKCLARIWKSVEENDTILAITADHGNVELMIDKKSGKPHTAHTLNPVPFLLCSHQDFLLRPKGILSDIAPTILEIMEIKKPTQMTGLSLLNR